MKLSTYLSSTGKRCPNAQEQRLGASQEILSDTDKRGERLSQIRQVYLNKKQQRLEIHKTLESIKRERSGNILGYHNSNISPSDTKPSVSSFREDFKSKIRPGTGGKLTNSSFCGRSGDNMIKKYSPILQHEQRPATPSRTLVPACKEEKAFMFTTGRSNYAELSASDFLRAVKELKRPNI